MYTKLFLCSASVVILYLVEVVLDGIVIVDALLIHGDFIIIKTSVDTLETVDTFKTVETEDPKSISHSLRDASLDHFA